eukprot:scaffold18310_cov30-Phaeocystis_antarctica.AAC.1
MVFRAQGESPASCARERGLAPAAPMLQNIVKKNILLITASPSEAGPGFRAGAGIRFRIPLTGCEYGRMLPELFRRLAPGSSGF